ncbi:MAG: hypothetical protein AB8B74_14960 [Crocinitomicaceae bacterium]
MKIVSLLFAVTTLIMGNVNAQSQNSFNGGNETKRIINNKKFRLYYQEVTIDKSVEEVWNEVAGNFVNGGEIAKSINSSKGLTGDLITGLGAERYLDIDFQGKSLEVKERIIDFQDCGDHREFTYEVYESKGAPVKISTYNTWSVRKGKDGKTYLGNLFIYRANLSFLTGFVGKLLIKSGSVRTGLLTYKHYLETGEKKVATAKLNELYPLK